MKKTGAWLVRHALEQVGVKYTFGIPGVHNTEIYDELNKSDSITPYLVTHEESASFMADAVSRTTDSIGTLVIVPAAGVTHAASGIGEAFLDGVPMLIISGGVRTDGNAYQLHDMDQHALLKPITKGTWKVTEYKDIVPTLYKAYKTATSDEPGPVFVEIPVNLQLFTGEIDEVQDFQPSTHIPVVDESEVKKAVEMLVNAQNPGIFAGWGAKHATEELKIIAEKLSAPVSTTLQGVSVFPANHPLHTGMSFGRSAVPAAENAFKNCDCLLAVATRFSEIPTGSFGVEVPEDLIHVDINAEVFNANYPAKLAVKADAKAFLAAVAEALPGDLNQARKEQVSEQIAKDKASYLEEWYNHDSQGRVNPARFFQTLRKNIEDEDIVAVDDGNHTFLAAELMPINSSRGFISPTDFNAMGYCVPATIAAKLANPNKNVVGIVGDGAFMMTGLETVTAVHNQLGCAIFIFNDGELSQIAQAQSVPYNRKTCTVLPQLNIEGVAMATGAEFIEIENDEQLEEKVLKAMRLADENKTVLVNVKVDYSKRTRFTEGAIKTNLDRFDTSNKLRFIGRAIWRKITG